MGIAGFFFNSSILRIYFGPLAKFLRVLYNKGLVGVGVLPIDKGSNETQANSFSRGKTQFEGSQFSLILSLPRTRT
jgi:hypothetical protein